MIGHPAQRDQADLRAHQHDPRRRRPRVRARRIEELMAAGMELFQYGLDARAGPARQPAATTSPPRSCRPRSRTRTAGTSSRPASSARSSSCSSPRATRRRATRSATACSRSRRHPDQRAHLDRRLRRACRRPRSRRSCAGRRRSSTSAAPRSRDTVVGGQEIKAGEKVVMFYNSANRDERAFADPYQFDVLAHAQRARRLRRRRSALLPRRQPRPPRDQGDVRGAVPPPARHRDHRRARLCSRARSSTASSACRAPGTPSATRRRAFRSKGRTVGQPVVHFEIIGS